MRHAELFGACAVSGGGEIFVTSIQVHRTSDFESVKDLAKMPQNDGVLDMGCISFDKGVEC